LFDHYAMLMARTKSQTLILFFGYLLRKYL
jgi:hypothetical protein